MKRKILTSGNGGIDRFHGYIGDLTELHDSFGRQLFIGDLVLVCHNCEYNQGKFSSTEYGVTYVCEENTSITNWTNTNHQFVMGLSTVYSSLNAKLMNINFELNEDGEEVWREDLLDATDGWTVRKIKDCNDIVPGEKWDQIYLKEVETTED